MLIADKHLMRFIIKLEIVLYTRSEQHGNKTQARVSIKRLIARNQRKSGLEAFSIGINPKTCKLCWKNKRNI